MRKSKLNILSISLDGTLLDQNSESFKRHLKYASFFSTYTVIVLSTPTNFSLEKGNLHVYSSSSLSKIFYPLDVFIKVRVLSKKNKFDVVTVQDPFITGLCGLLIKVGFKLPLNIQIHSEFFNTNYFKRESLQNFIFYFLGLFVLHFADSVRARNLRIRHDIEKRYPNLRDKIFYVGTTISEVFLGPLANNKRFKNLIVACGRLCRQKNYPLMLSVFKKALERYPKLKLEIIGDGEDKDSLILMRNKLGLESRVVFLGKKSPEEIKKIFDKAGFFLLTSNHEGWGLVCLEALARGLPVVMTDTGCAGEIVIDRITGKVSPVGEITKLLEGIDYTYSNYKCSLNMAVRGRKNVLNDVNLKWIGNNLLEMYEKTTET